MYKINSLNLSYKTISNEKYTTNTPRNVWVNILLKCSKSEL